MSMGPNYGPDGGQWVCGRCRVPLEQGKVPVFYLNSAFDVFLPRCPQCGLEGHDPDALFCRNCARQLPTPMG